MTETSTDSPSDGQNYQTLNENTTRAEIFPAKQHKEEWWEEAEHEGSSLSRYLYDLIQEARMYRDSGAPFIQTQDQTVKQLQNKIDDLQSQLEEARQGGGGGRTHLSIDDLVTRILNEQYQSLDELIERISASDEVANHLQGQIENRLYSLAEKGRVEYQRGHGWRLKEEN
ncbi:hypothetical protein GJR96_07830 [Haloferax sp. MBLA0076]|uniref:Uncharacterized protein n=1 Tax=Haloferax litoreum TaxID=2666140 RepID=A0A6A8GEP5_9EURY|nr:MULTISPECIES: hypothetical protein [Haloferax]KAB1193355.1 hypothetical protein Hfx1148_07820 [Haloferax sp. CBA1148]MRX21864.1 hypothetical protein [Haloferax litoreum]